MNILQFENATMQALHEKAATVANAAVTYGPFVGAWWEQYLSVVIEEAQLEQRLASSKDVAEIRGFYDMLARDHDKTIEDLKMTTAMLLQVQLQLTEAQKRVTELSTPPVDAEALHDTAIEADDVRAPDVIRGEDGAPDTDPFAAPPMPTGPIVRDPERETMYDNPVTYTARPNPFAK